MQGSSIILLRVAPFVDRIQFDHRIIHEDAETLQPIIRHECIHVAMMLKGLPYHDGEYEFEKELFKHRAPSNFAVHLSKRN